MRHLYIYLILSLTWLLAAPGLKAQSSRQLSDEEFLQAIRQFDQNTELDIDHPALATLPDNEIFLFLQRYFSCKGSLQEPLQQCSWLLYNVRNDKVRNAYLLPTLLQQLQTRGLRPEMKELLEDISLCSGTQETLQQALNLTKKYEPLQDGQPAPDFKLGDESGKKYSLSDFQGKQLYLLAWNINDSTSLRQLNALMDNYDQIDQESTPCVMAVVHISNNEREKKGAFNHLRNIGNRPREVLLLNTEENSRFVQDYLIDLLPRAILIDRQHQLINAWSVLPDHQVFSFLLNHYLKQTVE